MTSNKHDSTVPPAAEIEKPEDPEELHDLAVDDKRATEEDYHPVDPDPEAQAGRADLPATDEEWADEEDWVEHGAEDPDPDDVERAAGGPGGPR